MYELSEEQEIIPLDKCEIFKRTTEEEIFRHFIGEDFRVEEFYHSPLRNDDTDPSFRLYYNGTNKLRFKDFGGLQGDCFAFVMALEDVSFFGALSLINSSMGLGLGGVKTKKQVRYRIKKGEKRASSILQVKVQPFTAADKHYWGQYGISSATLGCYNVHSCELLYCNKKPIWWYSNVNPIYAYLFNSGHVKAYRPLAGKGRDSLRFLGNCNRWDLQGEKQLPEYGELLIITKSMKDVMLLSELGYNAVAPHGEGYFIPEDLVINLRDRFVKKLVIYDRDTTGLKNGPRVAKIFKGTAEFVPTKFNVKDPADMAKKVGKKMVKEWIKELLN